MTEPTTEELVARSREVGIDRMAYEELDRQDAERRRRVDERLAPAGDGD